MLEVVLMNRRSWSTGPHMLSPQLSAFIRNWRATNFRERLDAIKGSYLMAKKPFERELQAIEEAHHKASPEDHDPEVWTYQDHLSYRAAEVLADLADLRNAFAVMIYHRWERSAHQWIEISGSPNHEDITKKLTAAGISFHEDLKMLQLLANVAKHNSAKYGPKLFASHRGLFKVGFDPQGTSPTGKMPEHVDWAGNLALTDEHIPAFCDIVAQSSPR
ncbi:hypothetical protein [Teichococcus deserti]|uniref:hypothetical protein n=1 Tax=Teichococcus deserti TaxID=1817963 RepID=UPI001055A046|nr:hypothetical protein [Pseudoroseomonas deserti]